MHRPSYFKVWPEGKVDFEFDRHHPALHVRGRYCIMFTEYRRGLGL